MSMQLRTRTSASKCPTTAVKEMPLTGRGAQFLVFAPLMGYKLFKVTNTVNAPQ